ncbi:hypothetical protein [Burkholderia gladioli]|uniref:hypothetical protein n=1 Tax=Burkholderia gladioli TaxID=28095 RepID=UPI001640DCF1|nr:hypothetical protein [Burkholderia gladioli]MDC6127523.1 hypothetical protein [Burkholderia gladioli]
MKSNAVKRLKASALTAKVEICARFIEMSTKLEANKNASTSDSPLVDFVKNGVKDWDKVLGAFKNLAQAELDFYRANGVPDDHEMVTAARDKLAHLDQQVVAYHAALVQFAE